MKLCLICQSTLTPKAIKEKCARCRHKESSIRHRNKYKEKYDEYGKKYREENREICKERSKKSRQKKIEKYKLKTRILYCKKMGYPEYFPSKKKKNGEGNIDAQGYKTITKKGHPNQMDSKGRIREHVFVMSKFLGRPLMKGETVHHKNGDRLDNSIENLELWHRSHPPGQRVEDKIKYCIEFLTLQGYKIEKV